MFIIIVVANNIGTITLGLLFICTNKCTQTHILIYIYMYIYMCVCVYVYVCAFVGKNK